MSLAAAATMAHATTEIYFTGSTAFRGAAVDAIHNIFDSGTLTYAYTGTTETKQDAGVYSGTIGGVAYIIKTTWTGSEAGIQAVADTSGIKILFPSEDHEGNSARNGARVSCNFSLPSIRLRQRIGSGYIA